MSDAGRRNLAAGIQRMPRRRSRLDLTWFIVFAILLLTAWVRLL